MRNAISLARRATARVLSLLASVAMVSGFVVPLTLDSAAAAQPTDVAQSTDVSQPAVAAQPVDFRVLVFSKTAGFRHGAIPLANALITQLAADNNFEAVFSEDATVFDPANAEVLAGFDAIVFNSTTGDVLDAGQQSTFEAYIRGGGGFAGIHSATDTEYDWAFYGQLIGGYFNGHPAPQLASITVEDDTNESTKHLEGDTWDRTDEWYNFRSLDRDKVHVLLSLDEKSYTGGNMGPEHPISWCQEFEGGRSWYTGLGHTDASYSEVAFQKHVLGGLKIAAGVVPSGCSATQSSNYEVVTLDDNTQNPMALDIAADGTVFYIERNGRLQQIDPVTRATSTALSLPVTQANEDGLLGVALDPAFAANGWVYLYWAPSDVTLDGPHNRISRYTYDFGSKTASVSSEKTLLKVTTQRNTCCHAGGDMLFDNDGNLILATGDNTNPFESDGYTPIDERSGRQDFDAQRSSANTNDLRGKVLRITPTIAGGYSIPGGNLFAEADDSTGKTRPEIYAMGFRNPFRIGIDPKTNLILVADYGPDAGGDNPTRGPRGSVEWNLLKAPGNYGWPYCAGGNCYRDYNFATLQSGAAFSPENPINTSPNNTGLNTLPPVIKPDIWYTGSASAEFPEIGGGGAPMGGPVYRYDADLASDVKWPEYWDGKAFFGEWNQGKMYSFQLNESTPPAGATAVVDINRILPGIFDGGPKWHRSMDFTFGPDGALYIIDWGSDFGGSTADSGVFKVNYVKGSSSPIARASADVTSGPATSLTVAFSSAGTRHPLSLDYSLQWNFGDGSATSAAENPTHTYTAAGEYTAQLTVTDILGKTAVANVKIVVGNALPAVTIDFPENGGFFEWGDQVAYEVTVSDPDSAGAIDCSKVRVLPALGHDSHNHDFGELSGCQGTIQTIRDAGHGLEANLFWVINVSYTDDGGAAQVPLTGFGTNVLNPKHFQAEYFDSTGRVGGDGGADDGVKLEVTGDAAGGGRNLSYVDANDFWSYEPVNLVGIDSITLRTASGYSGSSTIEARWGSETGPAIGSVVTSPTLKNGSPDWQTYSDFEMSLDAGRPTGSGKLFFVSLNGGVNVNSMVFVGDGVQSNTRPEVDLTVDSDSGVAPHTVTAIAAATDPDGNTAGLSWQWDRGDGNGFTPGAMTERFDYLTAGIHKLSVRVTDEGGAYTDVSKTITVTDPLTGICLAGRSDGFDGTSLDTGRWNRNVRTNQFLTVEGGGLVIPASLTDLHAAGTGTPNLVLQDLPSGAFTATAKVNFPARLMYQQAGLIIYGDDDNYLKLVNMARGGTSDASNRVFQFLKETGAVPVETNTAPLGVGFPDTFYVRLVSDGTTLTAQYSADGTNYTSMETTNGLSGMVNPRIGLLALGSTSTAAAGAPLVNATFDWFQVTPDDTVPASTPHDEFDGTALNYCRWAVVNERSAGYRVQDGSLRIDTSPFDIYGADSGVENLVVQAQPAGDWVVETRVDASALDRQYQQGGLILYGDDSNYIKVDILATNAAGSQVSRNVEMRSEIGGVVQNPQPNAAVPVDGIVHLRLAKVGSTYTGFLSPDGITWTQITGEFVSPGLSSARVGLFALGNVVQGATSNTALFDYFRVVADPLEVTAAMTPGVPAGAHGWYSGGVSVSLATAGGVGTIYRQYNLNNGGWLEYTTPIAVTTDGVHQLSYRASSDSDATVETTLTFSIDTTLPTQAAKLVVNPVDPALRTVEIASADTTSGIDSVHYAIDDGDWISYAGAIAVTAEAHTVRYRSMDMAGNQSATGVLAIPLVPVDMEPVVTVVSTVAPATADGQHGWWKSSVTVSAIGASTIDGEVSVFYRINEGGYLRLTAPVEIVIDGTTVVTAKAIDAEMNESPEDVITIRRDVTPPTAAATRAVRAITLSGKDATSGIDRIEFRMQGDPAGMWRTYSTPVELDDRAATVTYRSVDMAGNVSETGEIDVETVDPQPSIPSVVMDDPAVQVGDLWSMVGTGFSPNTQYEVWLLSSPQKVGMVTTDARGGLIFSFQVPLTLDAGTHHVEIRTAQGVIVAASGMLQVAAADRVPVVPAGRALLATTGSTGAGGAMPLGLALLACGGVVLIGARVARRRRSTEGG